MHHITATATIYLPQAKNSPPGEGRREVGYEYVIDSDGVHHAVLREGTPWRCEGVPAQWVGDSAYAADVSQRLPDEEHGVIWGDDISP